MLRLGRKGGEGLWGFCYGVLGWEMGAVGRESLRVSTAKGMLAMIGWDGYC